MSESTHIPIPEQNQACSTSTYQPATVSVPVTVKPMVDMGDPNTYCCGEPIVTPLSCALKCSGTYNGSCKYTITQNICIEVPIEFSAVASVGCPCVECGIPTTDMCEDC